MITAKQAKMMSELQDNYKALDEFVSNEIERVVNLGKTECLIIIPNSYNDKVHHLTKELLSKGYYLQLHYDNNSDDKYRLYLNWSA